MRVFLGEKILMGAVDQKYVYLETTVSRQYGYTCQIMARN